MIYLINQDWGNTSGNHTGIKYLCEQLQERYAEDYTCITVPDMYARFIKSRHKIIRKIQSLWAKHVFKIYYKKIGVDLLRSLKDDDVVFLMEYMIKFIPQEKIAQILKKKKTNVLIMAMPHHTPLQLEMYYGRKRLYNVSLWVDKLVTLGSSLSLYLKSSGIQSEKIFTSFHYVDNDYYSLNRNKVSHKPTIIVMGNNARNVKLLDEIVSKTSNADFIICQGMQDYSNLFAKYSHVRLMGYVSEAELKGLMAEADISLNVMADTVGSNVIVTSMAMGLAMIVSDVGSIRDYCDDSNAIFCHNHDSDSFSLAINSLLKDYDLLAKMQRNSVKKSKSLSIDCFENQLKTLITESFCG